MSYRHNSDYLSTPPHQPNSYLLLFDEMCVV